MNNPDPDQSDAPSDSDVATSDESATDKPLPTKSKVGEHKARPKAPPLKKLGQLLRAIYQGKSRRTKLDESEVDAMRAAGAPDETERQELFALACADHTLVGTRQLLLLTLGVSSLSIKKHICEFACEVLKHHPAFASGPHVDFLNGTPDAPSVDRAVQALVARDYSSLNWTETVKLTTEQELKKCKRHAVHCLLLWVQATKGMSINQLQNLLQRYDWAAEIQGVHAEPDKFRTLIASRDPAAAAIASACLESHALEQSQRANAARQAEEKANAQVRTLTAELTELGEKLSQANSVVEELRQELAQEIEKHKNNRAHLKDDYEQLRGQILRRLTDELTLLEEGLHALRREPPKVHVMIDHADRAIEGLRRETKRLKGDS